jgi:hypothetical protein
MKKSILDQFASDAINAPAAVTGGGNQGNGSKGSKGSKQSNRGQSKKSDQSKRHN